jgi:hypothetical protein
VHVLRSDGTPLPGWPRDTGYWIYGPPAVGDIDGDGSPDVAVGDQVLSGTPVDRVYAWNAAGDLLPGFPIGPIWAVNTQILLADLDGDDQVELMFDDNTSLARYMGYNHDGTPMDGWPLPVVGTSFFINPFAADVNGDGELDLSGGGEESSVTHFFLWDANVPVNPAKNYLTILQYNPQHDGVYRSVDPAGVAQENAGVRGLSLVASPNPTGGITRIDFSAEWSDVPALKIYSMDGRLVRMLSRAGSRTGEITWEGRDEQGLPVPAGTYLCVARSGGHMISQRIVRF